MSILSDTSLDMGFDTDTAIGNSISTPSADAVDTSGSIFTSQQPKFELEAPEQVRGGLSNYFKNPTELLESFVGDTSKITEEEAIEKLEKVLSEILDTTDVYGEISKTNPEDIEEALKTVSDFKRKSIKKEASFKGNNKEIDNIQSKDDRFYKLYRYLITK